MTKDTMKEAGVAAEPLLFDDWFDAIEDGVRARIRGFIETMLEEEPLGALSRPRYGRGKPNEEGEPLAVVGVRHGHRKRDLTGAFGRTEISVPRAQLAGADGRTSEWRSEEVRSDSRRIDRHAAGLVGFGGPVGCAPGPGHELVDAGSGPEVDELHEHVGEIGLRFDVVELAGLDQRGDASPVRGPLVVAGEEGVLAIEHDRPDSAFDDVGVELDAAVIKKTREPVPIVQAVTDVLGDRRLAGHAGELPLEEGPERRDQRLALLLARHPPPLAARAADRLLDR